MPRGKWGSTTNRQVSLLRLRRSRNSWTSLSAKLPILVNQVKSFKFLQTYQHEFTSFIPKNTLQSRV